MSHPLVSSPVCMYISSSAHSRRMDLPPQWTSWAYQISLMRGWMGLTKQRLLSPSTLRSEFVSPLSPSLNDPVHRSSTNGNKPERSKGSTILRQDCLKGIANQITKPNVCLHTFDMLTLYNPLFQ